MLNLPSKLVSPTTNLRVLLAAGLSGYAALAILRLYLANRYYLDVEPTMVLVGVVVLFVASTGGCLLLLTLVPCESVSDRLLTALLAALFVYDSGLFFLLPELDGVALPVQTPRYYGLDVVLIFGLIGLTLWIRPPTHASLVRSLVGFSILLISLQVVVELVRPAARSESFEPAEETPFTLSPRRNVIHLLFDTFQGTELQSVLQSLGGDAPLEGFVWYRDTIGVNVTTSLTLPSVFSGRLYDEATMRDFYGGTDRSILDLLAEQDFDQHILTALPMPVPESATVFPARSLSDEETPGASGLGQLFDLFLIRAGPFLTKNWFLNDYNFRLGQFFSPTASFGNDRYRLALLNFSERLTVSREADTRDQYFFLHLIYPHPPFSHEADCTVAESVRPTTDAQNRIEHLCAFRDFLSLLDRLKKLGVYDRTLIVMHGDTGAGLPVPSLQDPGLPEMARNGSAFPVLLVKPLDGMGGMTVSTEPASIRDIPNAIAGGLRQPPSFPGADLLSQQDGGSRRRRLLGWEVAGNALSAGSWTRTGDPDPSEVVERPPLAAGQVVSFRGDGTGFRYRGEGWTATKAHGTWALYPRAQLVLPFQMQNGDRVRSLRFRAWLGGPLEEDHVLRYSVDRGPATPIELERVSEIQIQFEIPIQAGAAQVEIEFLFERPLNDQISDKRPLGFLVDRMQVQ